MEPRGEEEENGEAALGGGSQEATGNCDPQKQPVHDGLFSKHKSTMLRNPGFG